MKVPPDAHPPDLCPRLQVEEAARGRVFPVSFIGIWDNAPAHGGRENERTAQKAWPGPAMVNLQLMNLPGCSPDFNAGGVSWGWAREEATGKPWLGNKEAVTERRSAASCPVRLTGKKRSGAVAGRCCNQRLRHSCDTLRPAPGVRQMHILPRPWFSSCSGRRESRTKTWMVPACGSGTRPLPTPLPARPTGSGRFR